MRLRFDVLTATAMFLALALLVVPATGWAAPGDPDDDGLYTMDEVVTDPLLADSDFDGLLDGWEATITGTDPADPYAHDDSNLILDGLWDSDGGGVPDGVELVNGSNPFVDTDDSAILAPVEPIGLPMLSTTPKGVPVSLAGLTLADGSYILQFDSSPLFSAPVMKSFKVTGAPSVIVDATLWKAITAKGDVVYWRVLKREGAVAIADPTFTGRRWSSLIRTVRITGGPVLAGPADASDRGATSVPTFSWTGAFPGGFRVLISGSHRSGSELAYPSSATLFPATKKSFKPTAAQWSAITAMGNSLSWRVVGKTKTGQYAFSERFELALSGGAGAISSSSLPSAAPGPVDPVDPSVIPTFSQSRGADTQYRFVFSRREDFLTFDIRWPATGWQTFTGETVDYTPSAAEWATITALGNPVFWTVRGNHPATAATPAVSTWGPVQRLDFFAYRTLIVGDEPLIAIPGLNPVPPQPTLTFTPTVAAGEDALVFAGDLRNAKAVTFVLPDNVWTPATEEPVIVARTETFYPYVRVRKALTVQPPPDAIQPLAVGDPYSQFSEPSRVAGPFLLAPTLMDLGATVTAGTSYPIRWKKSPSDVASGPALFYELQESSDARFGVMTNAWSIPADGSAQYSRSTKKNATGVTFRYRVRTVSGLSHSAWSNVDSKGIKWVPEYRYSAAYGTSPPFPLGVDDLDLDDNFQTGDGSAVLEGPGWISRAESGFGGGFGWHGDYHFITRGNEISGREKATYTPAVKKAGPYEIWVDWMMSSNGDTHVEYFVNVNGTEYGPYVANMWVGAEYTVTWMKLGTFDLPAGSSSFVQVRFSNAGSSHSERCDGVLFYYKGK